MDDKNLKYKIESETLRRLIKHLQENNELQNIDLMNLAGFCRNCISKWMVEEAKKNDVVLSTFYPLVDLPYFVLSSYLLRKYRFHRQPCNLEKYLLIPEKNL